MRRLFSSIVTAGAILSSLGVSAATLEAREGYIFVSGVIEPGDALRFTMLETAPPLLVILDSPGGDVADSIAMAQLIRDIGIPALIPAGKDCLSACALLFLAGGP